MLACKTIASERRPTKHGLLLMAHTHGGAECGMQKQVRAAAAALGDRLPGRGGTAAGRAPPAMAHLACTSLEAAGGGTRGMRHTAWRSLRRAAWHGRLGRAACAGRACSVRWFCRLIAPKFRPRDGARAASAGLGRSAREGGAGSERGAQNDFTFFTDPEATPRYAGRRPPEQWPQCRRLAAGGDACGPRRCAVVRHGGASPPNRAWTSRSCASASSTC